MNPQGNLIIGQSGGPTVVINETLCAVVQEATRHQEFTGIYGARHGIKGILNEDFIDLRKESKESLDLVANTPSSALGTCRYKPTKEDTRKVFEVFEKYNVKYFFYIGGNDSAETADIVNNIARKENYELRIFHLPKTIDDDLLENDHCPGFGSAARYVALCFAGNDLDNRALPGVKIDVVMGRHAGFLTGAAALARKDASDGPHLLYFPEHPRTLDSIVEDIDKVYAKYGRCLVAVSEGLLNEKGKLMIEDKIKEVDEHGNVRLSGSNDLGDYLAAFVQARLEKKYENIRVRSDTLGYAQRCFPGVVSDVDVKEAAMVGKEAVGYALEGDIDGSVALKRIGEGENYKSETVLAKLKDVGKGAKEMPKDFINGDGNNVTEKFIDYARPLIGDLPEFGRLEGVEVAKR